MLQHLLNPYLIRYSDLLLHQLLVDLLYHISHLLFNYLMHHHIHDHLQLFTLQRYLH